MGGTVDRRLKGLEEIDRGGPMAEIQRAWDRLSDEECALILAPYYFGRDPTPEESAVEAASRATMPDALIARAIGYREGLSTEEVDRRLREVTAPVLKIESHRQALVREEANPWA